MRKSTVTCDRCGTSAEAQAAAGFVSVQLPTRSAPRSNVDLCAGCAGELVAWLGELAPEPPEPPPAPPELEPPPAPPAPLPP